MKNLIQLLCVTIFYTLVVTHSYAQNEFAFVSPVIGGSTFNFPVNELNTKAVRHFNQEFRFAENESWFKIRDGYTVKFAEKDVQYRVSYNQKGNWMSTVKIYHEVEMPQAIRHLVKINYYDYAITMIEELTIKNQVNYVVHIDNNSGFKKLYVSDGELSIIEEYLR